MLLSLNLRRPAVGHAAEKNCGYMWKLSAFQNTGPWVHQSLRQQKQWESGK